MRTTLLSVSLLPLASALAQAPSWTKSQPANQPPAIHAHVMAYDTARQRTVLFGGALPTKNYPATWEFDGRNWTQLKPRNPPSQWLARSSAMAYDAARRRTVLVGWSILSGQWCETWEWDGVNWTRRNPSRSPLGRDQHGLVYDSARQRIVMYGGQGWTTRFTDTWEYDGTTWTERKPKTNPGIRLNYAMAYDAARRRTVLFGGYYQPADTWEWDGTAWTRFVRTTAPWGRAFHAMAYDTAHRRVVLHGGLLRFTPLDDTWEWDGATWTLRQPTAKPAARLRHALAFDTARQRLVLFGGQGSSAALRDTWEWGRTLALTANTKTISLATGGTQRLTLAAGADLRNKPYCIVGSISGTRPGTMLLGIHVPLNVDPYTNLVLGAMNTPAFMGFKGVIGGTGSATATLNVPKGLPLIPITLHHAFFAYDGATKQVLTASNPVVLRLR